ncbi:hypothetical protein YG5714_2128 [Sulfolobus islandicus Y.G.57.14]|jgi:hypothetical protein|uniref:Uncharacterized protein n=5 Tax=Saccharolobus islandicus TaxID=43080 RepID=M9UFB2_SACIS|nr:hypothetical protein [Sulfolobus islandicus]ACP46378.1 hypothetical protein YG5714_2128 [Sulfolobus islandicus Y.G.57.14]ACP47916.1 hypothetical protein YN1551_0791 [Sulfolobus islandicus Y.N.15.51]ADB87913.1 hypothetical protein LD85_2267 [Sulfolobus islandicus L.D.8.5]ADX83294.1 hypothetical protein SiH_1948 [Sulfolobus islandicus HVE10/4]AGJ63301.1 Hypothetical Protein SiL_1856 [Sulfolobus islandicus LAL14/1]
MKATLLIYVTLVLLTISVLSTKINNEALQYALTINSIFIAAAMFILTRKTKNLHRI